MVELRLTRPALVAPSSTLESGTMHAQQSRNHKGIPGALSSSLSHFSWVYILCLSSCLIFKWKHLSTVFQSRCEDCVLVLHFSDPHCFMEAVSNMWVPGSICLSVCFGLVFEVLGMKAMVLLLLDKLCTPEFHSHPAQLLFSNWQTHPNSSQSILPGGETVHLWYHPWCDLSQPSMNRTMTFSIMSANFNIEGTIFLP